MSLASIFNWLFGDEEPRFEKIELTCSAPLNIGTPVSRRLNPEKNFCISGFPQGLGSWTVCIMSREHRGTEFVFDGCPINNVTTAELLRRLDEIYAKPEGLNKWQLLSYFDVVSELKAYLPRPQALPAPGIQRAA